MRRSTESDVGLGLSTTHPRLPRGRWYPPAIPFDKTPGVCHTRRAGAVSRLLMLSQERRR